MIHTYIRDTHACTGKPCISCLLTKRVQQCLTEAACLKFTVPGPVLSSTLIDI